MFTNGFNKIAVSEKFVTGLISRHKSLAFENPATGNLPVPPKAKYFEKSTKRTMQGLKDIETLPHQFSKKQKNALKRDLLKKHISDYRKSHGILSSKEINTLRKSNSSTANIPKSSNPASANIPKSSKIPLILGGIGLAGAGLAAYKYLKNEPTKEELLDKKQRPRAAF